MSYCAYITRIKNLRKHTNADKLLVGQCFGNNVIVSLLTEEGELGIYFPTDGKLGREYCIENNLFRKKDKEGNNIGGFLDPEKCKIQALKIRGEKSDGLFMPLNSLEKFTDVSTLKEGDTVTILNGLKICEKYIPGANNRSYYGNARVSKINKRNEKTKAFDFPFFHEHIDTSYLAFNTEQFRKGDMCEITLKMHGTSQRTSYTIKENRRELPCWIGKIVKKLHIEQKPKRKWIYIMGTRRVVVRDLKDGGFYGNNAFRLRHHNRFVGKLHKGETVYYEIVGFVNDELPIMVDCDNEKTNDKEFIRQFGKTTRFSYGCEKGESELYVYRMTMANDDGYIVEYPYDLIKIRCEQIGVKYCPEIERFTFTTIDDLMERADKHHDGADPIGGTHVKEGIVVRIENREQFTAYKHKNWHFKVLEGIIKDAAKTPDMEEAQELEREDFNEIATRYNI